MKPRIPNFYFVLPLLFLLSACDSGSSSSTPSSSPPDTSLSCLGTPSQDAVYVSYYGNDSWVGDCDNPLASIQAGIDLAVTSGATQVYVTTGVYSESVTLAAGISVYGGYAPRFPSRDSTTFLTMLVAAPPTGAKPGAVNAIGLNSGTPGSVIFDGIEVFASDANGSGEASYGFYLYDSDDDVTLSNNVIYAGTGGDGSDGSAGIDGANGPAGSAGSNALDLLVTYSVAVGACTIAQHAAGAVGGSANYGGTDASGGNGGGRTCPVYDSVTTMATIPPDISEYGTTGHNGGGLGGAAGQDVWQQQLSCTGYAVFGEMVGGDGGNGSSGVDGTSGTGVNDSSGTVVTGLWSAAVAASGGDGAHGSGGGGGGSGAGAAVHASCASVGFEGDNLGSTGGGGGAGGQAGTGGVGGESGGASVGIFVAYSVLPASLPTLSGNSIYGGRGGDGGRGGSGGKGGIGGSGGAGGTGVTSYVSTPDPVFPSYSAGSGGNGGNGGHGGGGGGGAGGPAYGIYLSNYGVLDASAWKTGNTFTQAGVGGQGGSGGLSLGSNGSAGIDGLAQDTNY